MSKIRIPQSGLIGISTNRREVKNAIRQARQYQDSHKSGEFTLSDTTRAITVSYSEAGMGSESDTNYAVFFTALSNTGSPPTDAFVPVALNRYLDGFNVVFAAAPGAGNSVTYLWRFFRDV